MAEIKKTAVETENTKATETTVGAAETMPDNVEIITVPEDEEKQDNLIKLSKTYSFEGDLISEIDLTGIEEINAIQMQKIEALYRKITKNVSASPELTLDYALATANVLTGLPLEFLKRISGKDVVKIKSRVINFLYSED